MGVTHTLLPPRGKAGSGPSDSGGHFDPKMFAQLLQEEKGENGLRNEPDSSRNEALEGDSKKGESQRVPATGCPSSPTLAAAQVSRCRSALAGHILWTAEQVLPHHGHHSAHRSQHHVLTPVLHTSVLAPALLFGSLMGATGPQLWCLGPG